jgi:hypothetical protein
MPTVTPKSAPPTSRTHATIAIVAVAGISAHLGLRYGLALPPSHLLGFELHDLPLVLTLLAGVVVQRVFSAGFFRSDREIPT